MEVTHREEKLTAGRVLLSGVSAIILAVMASMLIHGYAHVAVHALISGDSHAAASPPASPIEALAGPAASFLLALVSFAVFVRFPNNLFFSALAFVSAAGRLPDAIMICIRLFFERQAPPGADEGGILALLHLHNPTAGLVILFFYSMVLLFLCIAVIHESKSVPWKWLTAAAVLALLIPAQPALAKLLGFPAL
jgi:hypothetical protein